jgi:hypothetical protein
MTPPKSGETTLLSYSMLALPLSILLSAMALSSLTILTLAAAYLDRLTEGSDPKSVRRAHLTLVTKKDWQ